MPFDISLNFGQANNALSVVVTIVAVIYTALTIALAIWAYKDMRARSRDSFIAFVAAIVVAILNLPGLLIYMILRPQETLSEQYQRSLEEEVLLREIEGKATCPGCSAHTHADWRLCPHCQTKLKKPCENCQRLLDLPWPVCPYCAHMQSRVERVSVMAQREQTKTTSGRNAANAPQNIEDIITQEESSVQ